jgi:uncharacterized protein DUF6650
VKFSEIAGRITGFSTPIFGVQWTPPQVDVEVARGVLVYLEDRRVLYDPHDIELPHWAVQSAFDIRHFLTDLLVRGGIAPELADSLRAMRAACRKFIATVRDDDAYSGLYVRSRFPHWEPPTFYQALGEMRGVFGLHIAQLAVRYGIDVPDELATILPLDPDQDSDPATDQ